MKTIPFHIPVTATLTILSVVGFAHSTAAQIFTPVSSGVPDMFRSNIAWGDYDNDDDFDLLITGYASGVGDTTLLYRNDGGALTSINAGMANASQAAIDWGDYDNDGDLDVVMTNVEVDSTLKTVIYRNDGGNLFTLVDPGIYGVFQGAIAWGDYDNDGDLDIVQLGSGEFPIGDATSLFRNDGNDVFVESPAEFLGVRRGSLDWGDYDNDGDLDILMTGSGGFFSTRTAIYRNDGDEFFVEIDNIFHNLWDGQARWGDFDQDGDLDFLACGSDSNSGELYSFVYRNDGADQFTDLHATIDGAGEGGSAALGDCDNVGDLEVMLASISFSSSTVYLHQGDSTFTGLEADIGGGCCGSIAWCDHDNDNDLDILITLLGAGTEMYGNTGLSPNTAPQPPTGLNADVAGQNVSLSWQPGTDAETPPTGLTYNIRIGTIPNGVDIVSPMSDPVTGRRRIVEFGNVSQDLSWTVTGLSDGTYFWSVQSIDNSYTGSAFANEGSFVIDGGSSSCCIPPSVGDLNQQGTPNVDGIDLSIMLDMLFISLAPIECMQEADTDFSGYPDPQLEDVTGIDLSVMLDHLFISLDPLPHCDGTTD